jgi:dTDP-4-amino-4,6-dideoxygalactose transaminase
MIEPLANPTYVTQPSLPPQEEFNILLEQIWDKKILTNNGPFHKQFEQGLADYLNVKYISLFSSGTLALITAMHALHITGEVITTPFSFVAPTHALWWNNIKPVFVDIEPGTYNIDPEKIESSITPQTTAILPVHVYGNPCRLFRIEEIAGMHGLKVIYDACHTFGETIHGIPVLNFGDLSVMSFHATKVFTTFEGGAIVCHDEATKRRIDFLKNFGFAGETTVVAPGINGKMNEFQAALGLLQLKYVDGYIEKRKIIASIYRYGLKDIPGLTCLEDWPGVKHSYSYFPVLINQSRYGKNRDQVYEELKQRNIFTRRYFYPLISQFPVYKELESSKPENLPVALRVTEEVLCLPLYPDLSEGIVNLIITHLQL